MQTVTEFTTLNEYEQRELGSHFETMATEELSKLAVMSGRSLVALCHNAAVAGGWWTDLHTGESLKGKRNVGEMLCLVHSEISEAMESHRKNLMDDKLPHRKGIEVELADAVIRIADLAGALDLDLGEAIAEKLAYNASRADHKPENRKAAGGKAY